MSSTATSYYLTWLKQDLGKRKQKDPRYSLRAYARHFGLDCSSLSRLMSGKEDLSLRSALKILSRLDMTEEERRLFLASVAEEKKIRATEILARAIHGPETDPPEVLRHLEHYSMASFWECMVHPDDHAGAIEAWTRALTTGEACQTEYRMRSADGTYRWHLARAAPVQGAGDKIVKWVGTCTDIHEQKEERERARWLAEISGVLEASLGFNETMAAIARMLTTALRTYAAVRIAEGGGRLRTVAVAHPDPIIEAGLMGFEGRHPFVLMQGTAASQVLQTGEPVFHPYLSDGELEQYATHEPMRGFVRMIRPRSCICVPLAARDGKALGVMSVARSELAFTSDEFRFVQEVARRASAAVEDPLLSPKGDCRPPRMSGCAPEA